MEVRERRPAVAVFGASMVFLYVASGVFHGVPYTRTGSPDRFRFFQRVGPSAIFVLIAGTNTPMIAVLLAGRRRDCLVGMWALTIAGAVALWVLPSPPARGVAGATALHAYFNLSADPQPLPPDVPANVRVIHSPEWRASRGRARSCYLADRLA